MSKDYVYGKSLYKGSCEEYNILMTALLLGAMASHITSLTIIYSTVYSDADQRKHQSSASLAFVRDIHRWPVNSPHKWPVARKMLPFDDVMIYLRRQIEKNAIFRLITEK